MGTRFRFGLVYVGALAIFFLPTVLGAQIPRRLKECLPYPTLAEEICELTTGVCEKSQKPGPTVFVDLIRITGGDSVPDDVRGKLVTSVPHQRSASYDWLQEVEEVGARLPLQEAGYFRPLVRANAQILSTDSTSQHVAVTLYIEEGHRYRLGSVQFRPASASDPKDFSFETLRQQIPLTDGEFFNVSKIRDGLGALSRLYGSLGYIDFTAELEIQVAEEREILSIVVTLNPQTQYRIGSVEIWGPDPKAEFLLQSQWVRGDVLNTEQLELFFKRNKAILPSDASREDVQIQRNTKEGTVEMRFDFRVCPRHEYEVSMH